MMDVGLRDARYKHRISWHDADFILSPLGNYIISGLAGPLRAHNFVQLKVKCHSLSFRQ